jgi:hypothetical protein
MGYRNYIGYMSRKDYNKIKSMTADEVYKFYDVKPDYDGASLYKGVYEFGIELYELGKYCDFDPPKKSLYPFFKRKETQEVWSDEHDFYIAKKEFLEYVIESYSERIKNYYNGMVTPFFNRKDKLTDLEMPSEFLNTVKTEYFGNENSYTFDFSKITPEEQTALFKIIEHVRQMRAEWTCFKPYDLYEGDAVVTSWKYEYAIFELVKIYKSFDWKKNVMIYYGY